MNANEAITAEIIKKAEAAASGIIRQAEEERDEVRETLLRQLSISNAAKEEDTQKRAEATFARRIVSVKLESRRKLHMVKQEMLDKAYELAADKINALNEAEYRAFYAKLFAAAVEDGDEIIVSERDCSRLSRDWLKGEAKKAGISITVSCKDLGDNGGMIVRSSVADTDLSTATLLEETKLLGAMDIAKILFGNT